VKRDQHVPRIELDSRSLLRAANAAGFALTPGTLRRLCAQDLLPRLARTGQRGLSPVWTFPPGTEAQLVTLLRWRKQTTNPDVLRVMLWLEGFAIPFEDVRAALTRRLRSLLDGVERELRAHAQRCGLDPDTETGPSEALENMAGVLARQRGSAAIPRRVRMKAADRARGLTLLMSTFGFAASGSGERDAQTVERVLGIAPNGRRTSLAGEEPWLTGPAEALFGAAEVTAFPRLLEVAGDATDAELAEIRRLAAVFLTNLPFIIRLFDAAAGKNNVLGMAGLGQMDQDPEFGVLVTAAFVAMFREGWEENLHAIAQALENVDGVQADIARALEMESKIWTANLAALPAAEREQVQRIIDAAMDGALGRGAC
jgi:hypothetical protein